MKILEERKGRLVLKSMNDINKAVEVLNNGGIIIFPTDTAFGIGCRIDNEDSIKKLFELRRRPSEKAVPVLISSVEMAKKYVSDIPLDVQSLIDKYWPGALTIVLSAKTDQVPELVRGGGSTIGIRMPNHKVALELVEKSVVPILAPSANFSGEKTPYKYEDLDPELVKKVDFVLKGETSEGNVSTVIDCSLSPWKIIREGAVKLNL